MKISGRGAALVLNMYISYSSETRTRAPKTKQTPLGTFRAWLLKNSPHITLSVAGTASIMRLRAAARHLRDGSKDALRRMALRHGLVSLEHTLQRSASPSRHLIDQLVFGWGNEAWGAKAALLMAILEWLPETSGPILECGSGLSTLLLATAAAQARRRVFSLEHVPEWGARVHKALPANLRNSVDIVIAPIETYGPFDWYAPDRAVLPESIGFVVCDGPPGSTRGGRYGLVPVLGCQLAAGTIILLDDAQRTDERAIIRRWCTELQASLIKETETYSVIRVNARQ